MAISKEQFIEAIKEMNVLELSELVKELEQVFGVSAASGMGAMPVAAAVEAEPVEEQTEFDVILEEAGAEKIKVIKVVRELTGLGLKEAKDLVDGAPKPVKEAISKADAEAIKTKLTDVGAKVTVK